MSKVKVKAEKNNDKSITPKQNKNGGDDRDKSSETVFAQIQIFFLNCCGSGTYMLNNYDVRDTIERDKWYDSTGSVHIHHKQTEDKVDEQTVESDTYVSVYSTKASSWSGLNQFSCEKNK